MVTEAGSPRRPPLKQGATSAAFCCPPIESNGRTMGDHQAFSIGGRMRGTEASVRRRGGGGLAGASTGGPLRSRGQGGVIPRTPRAIICLFASSCLSAPAPRFYAGHLVFHPRHARKLGFVPRSGTSCGPHPRSTKSHGIAFLEVPPIPADAASSTAAVGETWPPPHAGEGRTQILTNPCWRTNVSTGGGRTNAAG
jgi:hypothetical protein